MAQKIVQGNEALAGKIKFRRNELGLTIEEAASRAGVGTKTWSRYEAGESIRRDKCKGICKALNWKGCRIRTGRKTVVSPFKNIETMRRGLGFWKTNMAPEPPYPLPQAVIYCWTRSRRT